MKTVYKYVVPINDSKHFHRLRGDILAVNLSNDSRNYDLMVHAEFDETAPEVRHAFQVIGTGHPIPDGMVYVSTVNDPARGLVWHLYEDVA